MQRYVLLDERHQLHGDVELGGAFDTDERRAELEEATELLLYGVIKLDKIRAQAMRLLAAEAGLTLSQLLSAWIEIESAKRESGLPEPYSPDAVAPYSLTPSGLAGARMSAVANEVA